MNLSHLTASLSHYDEFNDGYFGREGVLCVISFIPNYWADEFLGLDAEDEILVTAGD
jgi:hypothetical protein